MVTPSPPWWIRPLHCARCRGCSPGRRSASMPSLTRPVGAMLRTDEGDNIMPEGVLSVVLKREHHEIDSAIAAFIEKLDGGCVQPEPLSAALEALRRHIYLEET